MEVPWFAEWSIHLSLLAMQACGVPILVPTDALFLLHPAAHTEGRPRGWRCACLPTYKDALQGWLGAGGRGGGAAHVALKKPHLQDQGPFQDALGVELLQAQMLALLFLSCAPQANCSYEGIKTRISCFLARRAYVKHLALVK